MFKDEIKAITLPQFEIPKLKGHTKIELTDVHTGKKEVIEHDNAITDGLQSYFRTLGASGANIFRDSNVSTLALWKTVLGGIFLFDNALPNNAKYMPAGTKMIANGSFGVANGASPSELGTYNEIESTSDANSISLVYDWLTSQGNGTIAAVALSSAVGGYIGYGNRTSLTSATTKKAIDANQTGNLGTSVYYASTYNAAYRSMIYKDNVLYQTERYYCDSGTTKIKVFKNTYPLTQVDIFGRTQGTYLSEWEEYHEFTLPEPLSQQYIVAFCSTKPNSFMLLPSYNVSSGATTKIYVLDIVNKNISTITFTNNTGESLYANLGLFFLPLDNTYALVMGINTNGNIYKINYQTGEVIGTAEKNGMGQSYGEWIGGTFDKITDTLFYWCTNSGTYYFYDATQNAFFPTNGGNSPIYYSHCEEIDALFYKRFYSGGRNNQYWCIHNPLRLMTINNLDTPVIKTASKTMKVTYTITRAS